MRTTMDGTPSPYPIGKLLPAIYQEDNFAMRWTDGLDQVVAPVISSLDCLDAYIDPHTAPADFLDWIASWVGMVLDENWPEQRRRRLVAQAVTLFRMRGTLTGLREHLRVVTGGYVEVVDNGGVAWSRTPGADLPGEDTPRLAVRVTVDDPTKVHMGSLDELVKTAKPAHVLHRLEVTER